MKCTNLYQFVAFQYLLHQKTNKFIQNQVEEILKQSYKAITSLRLNFASTLVQIIFTTATRKGNAIFYNGLLTDKSGYHDGT